ncbi:hypothetical protein AAFF_G00356490 [Aldrovandia affinis]|uniref:TRAF-type domain-containing protein n=1 Tax=Aldrovandia affinis TaxID=143900 RepID=A0AAD7TA42_9TELE|nr:hypothetical protein AAFF_G00356490 [Aldrovandia affinis]
MCDYSPARCRNRGCGDVLNLQDIDAHMNEDCEYRAIGACQKGCGPVLLQKDLCQGSQCCARALRAENGALLLKTARLEREAQKQRARWGQREQHLLAQVTSLHDEARLTAVTYQKKLHQHMLHINDITKQLIGFYEEPPEKAPAAKGVSHASERRPTGQRDGQVDDSTVQGAGRLANYTAEEIPLSSLLLASESPQGRPDPWIRSHKAIRHRFRTGGKNATLRAFTLTSATGHV